jgi:hypothetical protein
VFPLRWENPKSGEAGYSPVCRNERVRGVCGKPQVKCRECANQAFVPIDENIVRSHLAGRVSGSSRDFTAGVYPMLPDETCWFLVADFDKTSWRRDVSAFRDTARSNGVPVAVEQSRSGNGVGVSIDGSPLVTNRVARFARLFDAPRQMPLPNAG